MKPLRLLTGTCTLIFAFFTCEKWDLDKINYLSISIDQPTVTSIDAINVSGSFTGLLVGRIEDHGFVWSKEDPNPTKIINDGISRLGLIQDTESGTFYGTVSGLTPGNQYFLRAYIETPEETLYSDAVQITTDPVQIIMEGISYESGRSLVATARITDLDKGVVATRHGFVWSNTNPNPTLSDEVLDFGRWQTTDAFSYDIDGLQIDTARYIRPFAVINTDGDLSTSYGEAVFFDGVLHDVWEQRPDLPLFGDVFSSNDLVYIHSRDSVYRYDVKSGSTEVLWYFPYEHLFEIDQKLYGLSEDLREYPEASKPPYIYFALYAIDLETGIVEQKANINDYDGLSPLEPTFHSEAFTFTVEGKGFLGGGASYENSSSGGPDTPTDSLYRYDPQMDSWQAMSTVPFSGTTIIFSGASDIYSSTIYSTDDFSGIRYYNNQIYKYNFPGDTWERLTFFPGDRRDAAIGVGLENGVFFGGGKTKLRGVDGSWWFFDNITSEWERKADIPIATGLLFGSIETKLEVNKSLYLNGSVFVFGSPGEPVFEYVP